MKLDHVGVVVENIERSSQAYAAALGMRPNSPSVVDSIQRVRVQFLSLPGDTVKIELIEPQTEDSPVAQLKMRGGGLAHLCFAVSDIEQAVTKACEQGALVIQPPVPARAFEGRHIAFVIFRDLGVVEFVEEAME